MSSSVISANGESLPGSWTLLSKVQEPGGDSPFAEITDEDIDNLFND